MKHILGRAFLAATILILLLAPLTPAAAQSAGPIVLGPDGLNHDMAWLQANYGSGIHYLKAPGTHRFELRMINVMTGGDVLIRIWVFNKAGQPAIGQPTVYSYPTLDNPASDLTLIPSAFVSRWAERGVLNKNRTDGFGRVDYQIGNESWIKNGRGPYAAWVLSPSIPSDALDGIGWTGGTNHVGPTELFFYEVDEAPVITTPTPTPAPIATPSPGITPAPTVQPTGDLTETNGLLRQIIDGLRAIDATLRAGFRLGLAGG